MPVRLSIVIPSFNRPDLLRACLRSVSLHAPSQTEILVVDDGSPGAIASRTASEFPGVKVFRLPSQAGFCLAANAGIERAEGEIVELLNDDTEVQTGWAELALRAFRDPKIGSVAPLVLFWRCTGISNHVDSAGDRYYLGGIAGKRGHREILSESLLRPCLVFGASASSAFYRREAIRAVGGFASSFGSYFEDIDLAFRLRWKGYEIAYVPEARVLHHVSASYGTFRSDLLEQQSRNEELVFWRNLPSSLLFRALPLHFAVVLAKGWRHWRNKTLRPFLKGRWQAWKRMSEVCKHRSWLWRMSGGGKAANLMIDSRFWGTHRRPTRPCKCNS